MAARTPIAITRLLVMLGTLVLAAPAPATADPAAPPPVWIRFCPNVVWDQILAAKSEHAPRQPLAVSCDASGWSGTATSNSGWGTGTLTTSGTISATSVSGSVEGFVDYNTQCFGCAEAWDFGGTIEVYVQSCYAGSSGGTFSESGHLRVTRLNGCGATGPYVTATWNGYSAGSNGDCSGDGYVTIGDGYSFQEANGPVITHPDYPGVEYRRIGSIPLAGEMYFGDGFHFSAKHFQIELSAQFTASVTLGAPVAGCCFGLVGSPPPIPFAQQLQPDGRYLIGGVQPIRVPLGMGGDCRCCEYRQFVEARMLYWDDDPGCWNVVRDQSRTLGEDTPSPEMGDQPYGHRDDPVENLPYNRYWPDRATGCSFENADDPGFYVADGRRYRWEITYHFKVVHRDDPSCPPMSSGPGAEVTRTICIEGTGGGPAPTTCAGTAPTCTYADAARPVPETAALAAPRSVPRGETTPFATTVADDRTVVTLGGQSLTVEFPARLAGRFGVSVSRGVRRDSGAVVPASPVVGVLGLATRSHETFDWRLFPHSSERVDVFELTGPRPDTAIVTLVFNGEARTIRYWLGHGVVGVEPAAHAPSVWEVAPERNPARGVARLHCTIARSGACRVAVFDQAGRRVSTLLDAWLPEGARVIEWDGRDRWGRRAAPGVYFVALSGPGGGDVAKLTLTR